MFGKHNLSSNHSLVKYIFSAIVGLFWILSSFSFFAFGGNDLLNQAFDESKNYDTIVNAGNSKDAVGSQVFNKTYEINMNDNAGQGCFVGGNRLSSSELGRKYCEEKLGFDRDVPAYSHGGAGLGQGCFEIPAQGNYIKHDFSNSELENYCQGDLQGDRDIPVINSNLKESYIIRLTKLILRVSIAISVPIIIRGGIMYITAFGDTNKQKKAQNIIIYALTGIIVGLSSLAIIQLVLTITRNSLNF